jgi:AcrR family transcriptional regulator
MSTKERIITAAVGLFNESGTGAISTNHIAEALGISPGNLYYHFRNKEEIIRAILERMIGAWGELFTLPHDRAPTLADLQHMFKGNFTVLWDYRFFYREMIALMQRDPELKRRYQAVRQQGFANIDGMFRRFAAVGLIRVPDDPTVVPNLASICWIIGDFWLPFVEMDGELVGPERAQEGVSLMMQVLRPYLTDTALLEIRH